MTRSPTTKRGAFIAIEGCDGAGSTTQRDRLVEHLRYAGNVFSTAQPSAGPIGRFIRELLAGRATVDPEALQRLFVADRVDHLARVVEPARASHVVVCDRSELSTAVYYAAGLPDEKEYEAVESAWNWHDEIDPPTLTVVLVVPAEVAAERRAARGGPVELFEKTALQARVADLYARISADHGPRWGWRYRHWAERENRARQGAWIAGVDGTGTPEEVHARVWAIVAELLGLPR